MSEFWGLVVRLLVGSFLAPFALSFIVVPLLALLALTVRNGELKIPVIRYPVLAAMLATQVYFWGMWGAYCAALAGGRASDATAGPWLYYVVAFLFVGAPVGYLSFKEQQSADSAHEVRGIQRGSALYSGLAIIAFLVFSVWPGLVGPPYGWFLALTVPAQAGKAHALGGESGGRSTEDAPPREYVDHQYQFAFQFPADWKFEKSPPPGEAGEVRAIVSHPTKPMRVMAMVGHLGKAITKSQFESSPVRAAALDALMDLSLEQYKSTSRDIQADRMLVSEKRPQPSDAGVAFYISTAHLKGSVTMIIAGSHIVPFEKPYMLTFMMVTPLDRTATRDNDTITRVFNSFHVLGERPIK